MNKSLAKIQLVIAKENNVELNERLAEIDYLVFDDLDLAVELKADGLIITDLNNDISEIRKVYPNLWIGASASSIADCKNWELKGVDFIQFKLHKSDDQPSGILGSEHLRNMIPKKMEYGWMIMSLNTPVFILGVYNLVDLEQLYSDIAFYGVDITTLFEPDLSLTERITAIENLLI